MERQWDRDPIGANGETVGQGPIGANGETVGQGSDWERLGDWGRGPIWANGETVCHWDQIGADEVNRWPAVGNMGW